MAGKWTFRGCILGHFILFLCQCALQFPDVLTDSHGFIRAHIQAVKAAKINMAVTSGMHPQIVLVIILGRIKAFKGHELNCQRFFMVFLYCGNDGPDLRPVFPIRIVDACPVLASPVISLPVDAYRVNYLKKQPCQYAQCDHGRVIHHTDSLCSPCCAGAYFFIGRILNITVGITRDRVKDTGNPGEIFLHAPETAACIVNFF